MLKNKAIIILVILMIILPGMVFSQDNENKDSTEFNVKVGLFSHIGEDDTLNKVSITIEYLIKHYLNNSDKNIIPVSLTEDNQEGLIPYEGNMKYYSEMIDRENLHSLIIIQSNYSFDTLLSNIMILRKEKKESLKEVYKEVFKINLTELDNQIPPNQIIQEIPKIISAILSIDIFIQTNVSKAEVFFNSKFISYASPSITITANIGIYDIKVVADGYIAYEETLELTEDMNIIVELEKKFIETRGLSITGMLLVSEDMFPDNDEIMRLSALYSLSYFFPLFNINKFNLDFNLLILNVSRENTAYFYYDTDINSSEFISEIPFNSLSFFLNFSYEAVFMKFPWVSPFIGIGIGYTLTDIDDFNYNPETSIDAFSRFSYNLRAGISVNIERRFSLILEFRYVWLGDLVYWELIEYYIPQQDNLLNKVEDYYQGYLLLVGLRINI